LLPEGGALDGRDAALCLEEECRRIGRQIAAQRKAGNS